MLHVFSKARLIEGAWQLGLGTYSLAFVLAVLAERPHPDFLFPLEMAVFGIGGAIFIIRGCMLVGLSIVETDIRAAPTVA